MLKRDMEDLNNVLAGTSPHVPNPAQRQRTAATRKPPAKGSKSVLRCQNVHIVHLHIESAKRQGS